MRHAKRMPNPWQPTAALRSPDVVALVVAGQAGQVGGAAVRLALALLEQARPGGRTGVGRVASWNGDGWVERLAGGRVGLTRPRGGVCRSTRAVLAGAPPWRFDSAGQLGRQLGCAAAAQSIMGWAELVSVSPRAAGALAAQRAGVEGAGGRGAATRRGRGGSAAGAGGCGGGIRLLTRGGRKVLGALEGTEKEPSALPARVVWARPGPPGGRRSTRTATQEGARTKRALLQGPRAHLRKCEALERLCRCCRRHCMLLGAAGRQCAICKPAEVFRVWAG